MIEIEETAQKIEQLKQELEHRFDDGINEMDLEEYQNEISELEKHLAQLEAVESAQISPTMKIIGSSAHTAGEREKDDFYATDSPNVEEFIAQLDRDGIELPQMIWEPACGEGNISKVFEARGFHVLSSDLVDRGYGVVRNFLETQADRWDGSIITNPPYKGKIDVQFVEKAYQTVRRGHWVIMLFKTIWFHSRIRFELFQRIGRPTYIYAHSKRIKIHKNNEPSHGGNALDYSWFMWQNRNKAETINRLVCSAEWPEFQTYTNNPKLRGTL